MANNEFSPELTDADLARSYLYHELAVRHIKRTKAESEGKPHKVKRMFKNVDLLNQKIEQIEAGDQVLIERYAPLERARRAELMYQVF